MMIQITFKITRMKKKAATKTNKKNRHEERVACNNNYKYKMIWMNNKINYLK